MSAVDSLSRLRLTMIAIRRLRARYAVLALVLGLSTAAMVFGASISGYATAQSDDRAAATATLRQLQFYPDTQVITDTTIAEVADQPGVTWVVPFVRVIAGVRATGDDISVIGATPESAPPSLVEGSFGPDDGSDWIVLPSAVLDHSYRALTGGTVDLTLTIASDSESGFGRDDTFSVIGVVDPSYQVDAPNAAYVSLQTATRLYAERNGLRDEADWVAFGGYERATVQMDDQAGVDSMLAYLQARGFQAVSRLQVLDQVPGVIAVIRLVTVVISAVLLAISVMVTVLLMSALVRQRVREMGILRACGWPPALIWRTWLAEVLTVALGAVGAGTALGALAAVLGGDWLRGHIAAGALDPITYTPWALLGPAAIVLGAVAISASVSIKISSRFDVTTLMRLF